MGKEKISGPNFWLRVICATITLIAKHFTIDHFPKRRLGYARIHGEKILFAELT